MADGRQLKSYVVFKGVRRVAALTAISGVVVAYSKNGWMNEALTIDCVTRVWGALSFQQRLLVWDAYRCHLMSSVTSNVENSLADSLATSSLPTFLGINLSKKHTRCSTMSGCYQDKRPTPRPAGNMRAPDKTLCLHWVKEAWKSVTPEVIKKSFLACGISVNTDGTQDSEVSCLKQGQLKLLPPLLRKQWNRDNWSFCHHCWENSGTELWQTAGDRRSFCQPGGWRWTGAQWTHCWGRLASKVVCAYTHWSRYLCMMEDNTTKISTWYVRWKTYY